MVAASGATETSKEVNSEASKPTKATDIRVRKRSYRRALRRAEKQGVTSYRGQQLGGGLVYPVILPTAKPMKQPRDRPRLNSITWSCSDFRVSFCSSGLFGCGRAPIYMCSQFRRRTGPTRGTGVRKVGTWCMALRRRAGWLLLGLRADVVQAFEITGADEIVLGRVLHWRGYMGQQQLDIVNLCQDAVSRQMSRRKRSCLSQWPTHDSYQRTPGTCCSATSTWSSVFALSPAWTAHLTVRSIEHWPYPHRDTRGLRGEALKVEVTKY